MSNIQLGHKSGVSDLRSLNSHWLFIAKERFGKLAAKQEFTTAVDSELSTVDLSKTTSVQTFEVLNNIDEGLYRLGKDSKIENALATKTKISNDGVKIYFQFA